MFTFFIAAFILLFAALLFVIVKEETKDQHEGENMLQLIKDLDIPYKKP